MNKEIFINATINDIKVAITENGNLAEYYIETPETERIIGNIYLGKVRNIAQGINAAFVDIGFKTDAFLHFSDVDESLESTLILDDEDEEDSNTNNNNNNNNNLVQSVQNSKQDNQQNDQKNEKPKQGSNSKGKKNQKKANSKQNPSELDSSVQSQSSESVDSKNSNYHRENIALRKTTQQAKISENSKLPIVFNTKRVGDIQLNIEVNQEIIVQVTREAYSTKGVKVSSKIALPGRYLVLLPFDNLLGVSRKISLVNERKRLRSITKQLIGNEFGCIIRTAAKGKTEDELIADWNNIFNTWKAIEKKVMSTKQVPCLLYQDLTLVSSIVRDLFNQDVKKVTIDSKKFYKEILDYLKLYSPELIDKINLYKNSLPIFDAYGISKEIANIYRRKVFLKNGASLVIDQTEAMHVVDVNSGRAIESDQEKTAFKINMEAAKETIKQLRLRDIGGMVLIDFIDMNDDNNKKKLFYEVKKDLARDRAKTVVFPITQLGIMQITRQRINQNIAEKISDNCPVCNGSGRITSIAVTISEIDKWLRSFKLNSNEFSLILKVHPKVSDYLIEGKFSLLHKLMVKHFVKIKIEQSEYIPLNHFHFMSVVQQANLPRDIN